MMSRFRIAFQNCANLFPAGLVARAPATPTDVRAKVAALATSLAGTVGRPDVLALCEVYSQPLAEGVLAGMGLTNHLVLFRPSLAANETGLAIGYDPGLLRPVPGFETTDLDRRPSSRRPRWFAVLFELQRRSAGVGPGLHFGSICQ